MNRPPTPADSQRATEAAAAWFTRLRADDVSREDHQRFERWLAADPQHAEAYRRFEQLWRGTGLLAAEPPVQAQLQALPTATPTLADALGRRRLAQPSPRRRRWPAWAAAGVAALAVTLALPAWLEQRPLHTGIGEQRSMALADGTRVTLNTDSRLRVRYDGERRRVHLDRGQAYFQVAKEHRPFEVITDGGVVRALGTAFDVYRTGADVIVTVVEGTVMVSGGAVQALPAAERPSAPAQPASQILHAQQRVALSALSDADDAAPVEAVPSERGVAWLRGQLIFDDEALAAAIAEINRYSSRRVRIGDPRLGTLRMSGVYRIGEVSDFVTSVSEYFSLRVEVDSRGDYVLHGRSG